MIIIFNNKISKERRKKNFELLVKNELKSLFRYDCFAHVFPRKESNEGFRHFFKSLANSFVIFKLPLFKNINK